MSSPRTAAPGADPEVASVLPERAPAPRTPRLGRRTVLAVPDLVIAGIFLLVWIRPFALGSESVESLAIVMLMEFVVVHATAMTGHVLLSDAPDRSRIRSLGGLTLLYTLFAAGYAWQFRVWWPLLAVWILSLNRLTGVLFVGRPRGGDRLYVQSSWALSIMYFLGGATTVTFLRIPGLGVTEEAREAIDLPGGGLWIDEPQRLLAFGVIYFGLTGLGEILAWPHSSAVRSGIPGKTARSEDSPSGGRDR